jgi:hypothetical protein
VSQTKLLSELNSHLTQYTALAAAAVVNVPTVLWIQCLCDNPDIQDTVTVSGIKFKWLACNWKSVYRIIYNCGISFSSFPLIRKGGKPDKVKYAEKKALI